MDITGFGGKTKRTLGMNWVQGPSHTNLTELSQYILCRAVQRKDGPRIQATASSYFYMRHCVQIFSSLKLPIWCEVLFISMREALRSSFSFWCYWSMAMKCRTHWFISDKTKLSVVLFFLTPRYRVPIHSSGCKNFNRKLTCEKAILFESLIEEQILGRLLWGLALHKSQALWWLAYVTVDPR